MEKSSQPLVSIIVPCYNVENYLSQFFKCVIEQTYQNIELILINDGSTDKTELIIKENKDILMKRLNLIYINQKNKGLGGAINSGLKIFKGDYLCWVDPDDYLETDSIEIRVEYLENNPNIGIVTSDAEIREDNINGKVLGYVSESSEDNYNENQFELMINTKSIFCAGCHMIRTKCFLDVNPNREIYEARHGQNLQMLLPVYYKYKRGFLSKPLYRYVVNPTSMSHSDINLNQQIERHLEHRDIVFRTVDTMLIPKWCKIKYKHIFNKIVINDIYYLYIKQENLKESLVCFIRLIGTKYMKKSKIIDLLVLFKKKL